MKYYQNPADQQVYAYDENDPSQQSLIAKAIQNGWKDITGSWPPAPTNDHLLANCKAEAQSLLAQTDWAEIPSVTNKANSVYLTNLSDFTTYRDAVRALAVNPVTNPVFPPMPKAQWNTSAQATAS